MRTSLKPAETAGIITGASIVLGALIVGGIAMAGQCCRSHRPILPEETDDRSDTSEFGGTSRAGAIQMARELAYQKAVNELEDHFENEAGTPEDAAFVRKTLDFLSATLTAIG